MSLEKKLLLHGVAGGFCEIRCLQCLIDSTWHLDSLQVKSGLSLAEDGWVIRQIHGEMESFEKQFPLEAHG